MAIPPVSGVAGTAGVNAAQSVVPKAADGFGDTINKALQAVSDASPPVATLSAMASAANSASEITPTE